MNEIANASNPEKAPNLQPRWVSLLSVVIFGKRTCDCSTTVENTDSVLQHVARIP